MKENFIAIGQVCPKATTCQVKKKGQCNHQGINHKARYECHDLRI